MKVSILTGGKDADYALGLLGAIVSKPLQIDFVANDEMANAKVTKSQNVNYLNLRGDRERRPLWRKGEKGFNVLFQINSLCLTNGDRTVSYSVVKQILLF